MSACHHHNAALCVRPSHIFENACPRHLEGSLTRVRVEQSPPRAARDSKCRTDHQTVLAGLMPATPTPVIADSPPRLRGPHRPGASAPSLSRPSPSTRVTIEALSTKSRFTPDRRGIRSPPGSRMASLAKSRILIVRRAIRVRRSLGMAASHNTTTSGRRPIATTSHHASPRLEQESDS